MFQMYTKVIQLYIHIDVTQTKTNIIWYHVYEKSEKMVQIELVYKTKVDLQT